MIGRTRDDYELRLQQALRMRATGRSHSDIGRTIGITTSGVQRMLARHRKQQRTDVAGPTPPRLHGVAPACTRRPHWFDLDRAGADEAEAAQWMCRACPHLSTCRADPHPPRSSIYGGQLIDSKGRIIGTDQWAADEIAPGLDANRIDADEAARLMASGVTPAVALILSTTTGPPRLSARFRDMHHMIALGYTDNAVGASFGISRSAASKHRRRHCTCRVDDPEQVAS